MFKEKCERCHKRVKFQALIKIKLSKQMDCDNCRKVLKAILVSKIISSLVFIVYAVFTITLGKEIENLPLRLILYSLLVSAWVYVVYPFLQQYGRVRKDF